MPELDRREFLKVVGASAGAAATAGCSDPVDKLIPYLVQPEVITPGIPVYYASSCLECPAGCGLHVKTREGRPIKLEGNPDHPVNRGALCARGQVGIGRTYHPDRFAKPMKRGADGQLAAIEWDEAIALLAAELGKAGNRTWMLGGQTGPAASAAIDRWLEAVGAGGRVVYEPLAPEALVAATKTLFGVENQPVFDLSGSDLVVDFGSDFLETGLSPTEHAHQLASARDVAAEGKRKARFVYVGPRLSMTGSNADEWLAAKPGTEGLLALALANVALGSGGGTEAARTALAPVLARFDAASVAQQTGVPADAITRLGKALAQAQAPVALPPGAALASRRATATCGAVLLLDWALGAIGGAVTCPAADGRRQPSYRETLALVDLMKTGKVGALLVHGANPAYSLPPSAGFVEALAEVPFVVSFASMPDETSAHAHLILPDHTPLESWGDVSPRPGVRSLVQPTIRPLRDSRALVDTLLDAGRALGAEVAARLPAGSFRTILEETWTAAGADFQQALARGGVFADTPHAPVSLAGDALQLEVAEPLLEGSGEFALLAAPSPLLYDGRGADLPWLQEIADPVTKVTWTSWAELSKKAAERLGVAYGDVIAVETVAGSVEVPVFPRGGIRDDVVAIAVGQGHTVGRWATRDGERRGVNVIDILPSLTDESGGRAWLVAKASVRRTGGHFRFAIDQDSQDQRGRRLGIAVPLAALAGEAPPATPGGLAGATGARQAAAVMAALYHEAPAAAAAPEAPAEGHGAGSEGKGEGHGNGHGGGHEHVLLRPFDPSKDSSPEVAYRWGMTIDVDRCVGCAACVAACYVENNLPIVGENQVRSGRIMGWLRIERWIGDGSLEGGEGLDPIIPDYENLPSVDVRHVAMLCQQCGAAPCEPVCPVIATFHNEEGLNGMIYNRCIGTRYCANNCPYKVRRFNWYDYQIENWPEPMPLMLNPDVTVRGQGVMEKCTFCVQRAAAARQTAKDESRPIRDGEFTTACAQACPTQAITFGNLKDPASAVVQKSADPVRSYHSLHELNTRPAVTYLAQVTRGPVEG
ncbi:MAG: 4Fe-4S dicluster domain-containing protein [Deltaproteobacteria bacterium]|nr:4Fe-4S dicluster domain-containing protein [Deltaproteobacteria bacterium]